MRRFCLLIYDTFSVIRRSEIKREDFDVFEEVQLPVQSIFKVNESHRRGAGVEIRSLLNDVFNVLFVFSVADGEIFANDVLFIFDFQGDQRTFVGVEITV